jgi:hypothetical protein
MQREYTGFILVRAKKALRPAGKGENCISLHLSACVGVTSHERGSRSQVSKKEHNGMLLEMLISEVGKCLAILSFVLRCPSSSRVLLALPFYRLKERVRLTTSPRRCLGGEGGAGTIGVAVATCPGTCRPSLGRCGDVDDGTAVHPGCCRGRVIPCARRMGSSLLARLMAVEARSVRGGGGSTVNG